MIFQEYMEYMEYVQLISTYRKTTTILLVVDFGTIHCWGCQWFHEFQDIKIWMHTARNPHKGWVIFTNNLDARGPRTPKNALGTPTKITFPFLGKYPHHIPMIPSHLRLLNRTWEHHQQCRRVWVWVTQGVTQGGFLKWGYPKTMDFNTI